MTNWTTALGAALLTLSTTGAAFAQTAAAPVSIAAAPAPPAGVPVQTTATYGDWVLRCAYTGDGSTGPQTCEVVQTLVLQGQSQPIAQVAIGSIDKNSGLRLTVVVPTAISFSKAATVSGAAGSANPLELELAWRRCLPSGCFADIPLTAEVIKMMRARAEAANLVFTDAGERDITLPFSMRGLAQSLDALAKESAAK